MPAPISPLQSFGGRRQRTGRRPAVRIAALVLLTAGVLLLAEAAVTVLWQEPFTALSAQRAQHRLAARLRVLERQTAALPAARPSAGPTVSGQGSRSSRPHRGLSASV